MRPDETKLSHEAAVRLALLNAAIIVQERRFSSAGTESTPSPEPIVMDRERRPYGLHEPLSTPVEPLDASENTIGEQEDIKAKHRSASPTPTETTDGAESPEPASFVAPRSPRPYAGTPHTKNQSPAASDIKPPTPAPASNASARHPPDPRAPDHTHPRNRRILEAARRHAPELLARTERELVRQIAQLVEDACEIKGGGERGWELHVKKRVLVDELRAEREEREFAGGRDGEEGFGEAVVVMRITVLEGMLREVRGEMRALGL